MINVFININEQKLAVGRLVSKDKQTYFQYNPEFIATGLQLSPFHLPLNNQVHKAPQKPFNGLQGLFADSPTM